MRSGPVHADRDAVDFLVIGAQKAGTTSLHRYLDRHPQLFLPARKEVNFFVAEREWSRGADWYCGLFDGAGRDQLRGECSPLYTMFPLYTGVPERAVSVVPNVKLVYLVRHPVERAVSSYLHALAEGSEWRPADRALLDGPYLLASMYAMQLDQWLTYVPRERIHVVATETLASAPRETVAGILDFIGADATLVDDLGVDERHHVSAEKTVPRDWTRNRTGQRAARALRRVAPRRSEPWLTRGMQPADRQLSDAVVTRLTERVAPEVRRLRRMVGPLTDAWDID